MNRPGDGSSGVDLGIDGITGATLVGSGGTARVYKALQETLHRSVAVKILIGADDNERRQFDRESQALGQLSSHEGIVSVHDAGLTSFGEPYLVMTYCPSGSLRDLMDRGPIPWRDAVELIAPVATTIADAHDAGILHRDLKPGNVLIDDQGRPLVADFGLARFVGAATAAESATMVGFTPGYVPPESLTGARATAAGDVYSLGATLFSLLSGEIPFVGRDEQLNLVALAHRVTQQPADDLRPLGVPDALATIVESTMAKDPAARPDARELAARLGALASGAVVDPDGTTALTSTELRQPLTPVAVPPPPSTVSPAPEAPGPVPLHRGDPVPHAGDDRARNVLVAFGTAVAVLAVAGIGWFLFGRGGDDSATDDPRPSATAAPDRPPTTPEPQQPSAGATPDATDSPPPTEATTTGPQPPTPTPEVPTPVPPSVVATVDVAAGPVTPLLVDNELWIPSRTEGVVTVIAVDTRVTVGSVGVGAQPIPGAEGFGRVWISNKADDTVSVIDPAARTVVATVGVGDSPDSPTIGLGRVWIPDQRAGTVSIIDPDTLGVTTVEVGGTPITGVVDGELMWIPIQDNGNSRLVALRADGMVASTTPIGAGALTPAVAAGAVWVPNIDEATITAVPVGGGPAQTVAVGSRPITPLFAEGRLWVPNVSDDTVSVVDPESRTVVATVTVGRAPDTPVVAAGWILVANSGGSTVTAIRSDTLETVTIDDVGSNPRTPVVVGDTVWVANFEANTLTVVDLPT